MTVSYNTGTATGIHRGICVDNRDPLGQGRIRVQVPTLLGPLASGWAFPAWGMEELSIVPTDRLPDQGQGVWIFVDGEKLYWFAVYGAQSRPVPEVYDVRLSWTLPVMPLNVPVTVAGILSSSTGTPNPDPIVELQGKTGSTWVTLGAFDVGLDGAFSFTHTQTGTVSYAMFRIHFLGAGPFEETYSDERVPPSPANTTTIAWTPPQAVWLYAENVTGKLTTTPSASAAGGNTVRLMVRDTSPVGAWVQEGTATTDTGGSFAIPWTRQKTQAVQTQVVFTGSSLAGYAETSPIASHAAVSVPVVVTMNSPAMTFNVAGTVSGTMTTALYGVPPHTVRFQVRAPKTTGTWTDAATATPQGNGNWSLSYVPVSPSADYRAYYPASGVYQPGVSAEYTRDLAQTTTTTLSVPAALYPGSSATWTGTVKDALGRNVASGTVSLYYRAVTNNGSWTGVSTASVSNGTFSVSWTPTMVGAVDWLAGYGGVPGFLSSDSPATRRDVGLGTVALNKTGLDHTAIHTTWNAISGATSYETLLNGGLTQDTNELGCWRGGLAQTTWYTYQTRAKAPDFYTGATVYGAWSGGVSGYTGRPESRYSGNFGIDLQATASGSHRPQDGWNYHGDELIQGNYGGQNWIGVLSYDGGAFQNWVRANYGQGVLDYINANDSAWNETRVWMWRKGSSGSTSGGIELRWGVTPSGVGGGRPNYAGGQTGTGSLAWNEAKWFWVYPWWGNHVLLNQDVGQGPCQSLCIEWNDTNRYMRAYGRSAVNTYRVGQLYVNCSWNYVTVSYIAPYWA